MGGGRFFLRHKCTYSFHEAELRPWISSQEPKKFVMAKTAVGHEIHKEVEGQSAN